MSSRNNLSGRLRDLTQVAICFRADFIARTSSQTNDFLCVCGESRNKFRNGRFVRTAVTVMIWPIGGDQFARACPQLAGFASKGELVSGFAERYRVRVVPVPGRFEAGAPSSVLPEYSFGQHRDRATRDATVIRCTLEGFIARPIPISRSCLLLTGTAGSHHRIP